MILQYISGNGGEYYLGEPRYVWFDSRATHCALDNVLVSWCLLLLARYIVLLVLSDLLSWCTNALLYRKHRAPGMLLWQIKSMHIVNHWQAKRLTRKASHLTANIQCPKRQPLPSSWSRTLSYITHLVHLLFISFHDIQWIAPKTSSSSRTLKLWTLSITAISLCLLSSFMIRVRLNIHWIHHIQNPPH